MLKHGPFAQSECKQHAGVQMEVRCWGIILVVSDSTRAHEVMTCSTRASISRHFGRGGYTGGGHCGGAGQTTSQVPCVEQ